MNLADEVAHGADGISQLRALIASGRKPGILVSLNFDFVEVEPGRAAFEGKPDDHAYNPIGSVHGGYAATLLDSACGCAVHSRLSATQAYTTLELKVAYHKAITRDTGVLRAEGPGRHDRSTRGLCRGNPHRFQRPSVRHCDVYFAGF